MKETNVIKWMAIPALTCALILPTTLSVAVPAPLAEAATVSAQPSKQKIFNQYASDMLGYIYGVHEISERISFYDNIQTEEDLAGLQAEIELFLSITEAHLPTVSAVKATYGQEVAVIHSHIVTSMNHSVAAYKELLKIINDEETPQSEALMEKSWNDAITSADKYEKSIATYIAKYRLMVSDDAYYLLHGEEREYVTEIISHKVKKGETLYAIATYHDVSVSDIKKWNNLSSNSIKTGQVLQLQVFVYEENDSSDIIEYTYQVKKGDTLYAIAKKQKVSVSTLKKLNHLSSNTVRIGQVLVWKVSTADGRKVHLVQKGETLFGLSKQYKISVSDLKKENNLSSSSVKQGQYLIVSLSFY